MTIRVAVESHGYATVANELYVNNEWPHADCTDSPGTLKTLVVIQWVLVLALIIGAVVCLALCACVRRKRAREQTLTQEQAPAMVPEKAN